MLSSHSSPDKDIIDFNDALDIPNFLIPAARTSAGYLDASEHELIHHFRTTVWQSMSLQQGEEITAIIRDWVPQKAMGTDYMLNSIFGIASFHKHTVAGRLPVWGNHRSIMYRQKALESYSKALNNITSENYETLLITSMWMTVMVTKPTLPCSDDECLDWAYSTFSMMQGLRILASLKWASGIEKLTVYPLFRRELRKLPPPPVLTVVPEYLWPHGEWSHPNAPGESLNQTPRSTTASASPTPSPQSAGVHIDTSKLPIRPQTLMSASNSQHAPQSWKNTKPSWQLPAPAFLPPPLMALLHSLVADPQDAGPMDLHRPILIPVLHALSPIFLSLYYFRLTPDAHVRIFVLPTFLTPEFHGLVRAREPRALVLVAWYYALVMLVPQTAQWWCKEIVPRLMQAVSNAVMRTCDGLLMDAIEGAYRIVRVEMRTGKEEATKSIFEGWEGVNWEEGPRKGEEWRVDEEVSP